MRPNSYDVCVVGSGAGGATAFAELSKSGLSVLLVEEGPSVDSILQDSDIANRTVSAYRHGGLQAILGNVVVPFGEGRVVGGGTEVNGGLFWQPPSAVLDSWRLRGFHPSLSDHELNQLWMQLEAELGLGHYPPHNEVEDRDSELMRLGFARMGFATTPAQRVAPGCERANECPSICPNGAKQSMSVTLIPAGVLAGGHVVSNTRVVSATRQSTGWFRLYCASGSEKSEYEARALVLAAGALSSPLLYSSLKKKRIFPLELHLNMKVLARFPEPVHAIRSTIFTHQAQNWIHQGYIAMPANFRPEYVAMGLESASNDLILTILRDLNNYALYTVQIRPRRRGRIVRVTQGTAVPTWFLGTEDAALASRGLLCISEALFRAGAESVRLPLSGIPEATNLSEVKELARSAPLSSWLLTSVHAMSSLPMGFESDYCDENGAIRGVDGAWVGDASALPSSVGESPQGAVMLHARAMAQSLQRTILSS